jgi:hypothetical protein
MPALAASDQLALPRRRRIMTMNADVERFMLQNTSRHFPTEVLVKPPKKKQTDDATKSFSSGIKALGKPKPKADKTEKKLIKASRKDKI